MERSAGTLFRPSAQRWPGGSHGARSFHWRIVARWKDLEPPEGASEMTHCRRDFPSNPGWPATCDSVPATEETPEDHLPASLAPPEDDDPLRSHSVWPFDYLNLVLLHLGKLRASRDRIAVRPGR